MIEVRESKNKFHHWDEHTLVANASPYGTHMEVARTMKDRVEKTRGYCNRSSSKNFIVMVNNGPDIVNFDREKGRKDRGQIRLDSDKEEIWHIGSRHSETTPDWCLNRFSDVGVYPKRMEEEILYFEPDAKKVVPLSSNTKMHYKSRAEETDIYRDMARLINSDSPLPSCFPYHIWDAKEQYTPRRKQKHKHLFNHRTRSYEWRTDLLEKEGPRHEAIKRFHNGPNLDTYEFCQWTDLSAKCGGKWAKTNGGKMFRYGMNIHRIHWAELPLNNPNPTYKDLTWYSVFLNDPHMFPFNIKFRILHRNRIIGDPNFREDLMPSSVDPLYPEWAKNIVNRHFYDVGTNLNPQKPLRVKETMSEQPNTQEQLIDAQHNHITELKATLLSAQDDVRKLKLVFEKERNEHEELKSAVQGLFLRSKKKVVKEALKEVA
tara:strand:+ start:2302 stop:3594 length:1293 start_codon:yes stop_codon:yes gene_type:complete